MRRKAKAVNFGIIYGQSSFGLAKALDISQDEAAAFIDGYFARYSGVGQFFADTLAECRRQGYVTTMLGRRRAIQGVRMPEASSPASRPGAAARSTCPSGPRSTPSSKARPPT